MAYKNLINVPCASIQQVFRHVKDWLGSRNGIANYSSSGLGWTVHDSFFATNADTVAVNDWVVFRSAGENGKQDLYYYMLFSTLANSILRTQAGLYWDTSTNAWVEPYMSTVQPAGPTTGSAFNLFIFGSLDSFSIIIGNGSAFSGRYFGLLDDPMTDATVATSSGSITAGSNQVLTVDAVPASWATGVKVFIRDLAGIELATISAISGNDVTFATLVNGYVSGAKIARDYCPIISWSTQFLDIGYTQISRTGSLAEGDKQGVRMYNSTLLDTAAPDKASSLHLTEYSRVAYYGQGYYGRHKDILLSSNTGITSGTVYTDQYGVNWRALSIGSVMHLFREV